MAAGNATNQGGVGGGGRREEITGSALLSAVLSLTLPVTFLVKRKSSNYRPVPIFLGSLSDLQAQARNSRAYPPRGESDGGVGGPNRTELSGGGKGRRDGTGGGDVRLFQSRARQPPGGRGGEGRALPTGRA